MDQFPLFEELSSKNKLKELARIVERICHKMVNGDGLLYSCAISHAKLLFSQHTKGIHVPNTMTFQNLAFTLPDKSAAPTAPKQQNTVQLAVYSWNQHVPTANPLERLLIGDTKCIKLPQECISVMETAYRQDKLEETLCSEFKKGAIQSQQLERSLILFQNHFQPYKSWEVKQSNLFMSEYLCNSKRSKSLNKFLQPVRNDTRFKIHWIKQLQHVPNFHMYVNKRARHTAEGSFVTERLAFYGTGVEVPRNVILGSYIDLVRAEGRKKGKIFKQGIQVSSEFSFEDRYAYHCKHLAPPVASTIQRKQMIVCLVSICNPEKVEMKEVSNVKDASRWESIYVQLQHEGKYVTVFSINEARLVYPLLIIEYSNAH